MACLYCKHDCQFVYETEKTNHLYACTIKIKAIARLAEGIQKGDVTKENILEMGWGNCIKFPD